ncbi:MAG: glycerophosphodiester phosphodiesterase family protein [Hyphomonas sp.]|uniref:glycerophosphodiester phosphodiesterase family protein n=1 Tax=Hyphomonas sp. TaxID=87 RepID=UPI0034A027EC
MARRFDLSAFAYAHRGLWLTQGPPENSLAGFRAAAKAGLGAEFDLRPALDGTAMIFHDPLLDRMTGETGLFEQREAGALRAMGLTGSGERIPSFDDLLDLWPQDLPLLCEMKIDGTTDPAAFARTIAGRLADWPGLAAAMSFSEEAVRALPETLMRGQLVVPMSYTDGDTFDAIVKRAVADGIDYLALHHSDLSRAAGLATGKPAATWTVRSEADLAAARAYNPAIIFEHIDPAHAAP